MNNLFKFVFLSFLSFAIFTSCNDDPSSNGLNLIPDQDKIKFGEYNTDSAKTRQSTHYYQTDENFGLSSRLIIGKNSYAESSLLFQFTVYLPDSIKEFINNNEATVERAWIKLMPLYFLGDKNAQFDFSVHKILSKWSSLGFDRDSLEAAGSSFYDAADVAVSKNVNQGDSTFQFDLDQQLVLDWLRYISDTTQTSLKYHGIIVKPNVSNSFIGVGSSQASGDSAMPHLTIVLKKSSNDKDTLTVTPYMDTHVLTGTVPQEENRIYLEGSYPLRGFLFFDLSSLTKDLIISKAVLELTVDETKTTDGEQSSDTIMVRMMKDSTAKTFTSDSLIVSYLSKSGNVYSGDISWMIQRWLQGTANQGLSLELFDEQTGAARIALYGTKEANLSLRPRIKIIYSQKK